METLTHIKFNSWSTFIIALINTMLLMFFLYSYKERLAESEAFLYPLILLFTLAIQLGLIAYFDESKSKNTFTILTVVFLAMAVLLLIATYLLTGYGKAFNH